MDSYIARTCGDATIEPNADLFGSFRHLADVTTVKSLCRLRRFEFTAVCLRVFHTGSFTALVLPANCILHPYVMDAVPRECQSSTFRARIVKIHESEVKLMVGSIYMFMKSLLLHYTCELAGEC